MEHSPILIRGEAQHYQWGGCSFIPQMLDMAATNRPFAELWFGTHDRAPSKIVGSPANLQEFVQGKPQVNGGQARGLCFLLKILDVRSCLSIQVHPNKQQAEKGFSRENRLGIELDAPERNYRDDNHKPEVMVALTTCHLLYGFSEQQHIIERFGQYPILQPLCDKLRADGLERFYPWLMRLTKEELKGYLVPLLHSLIAAYREGKLTRKEHDYWVARAALEHGGVTACDPGLLAIFVMNLVVVESGQGIFQPARLPHAYLEGAIIELMANSDNVLRGGLTAKHIDIEELLAIISIEPSTPEIIEPMTLRAGLDLYPTPQCEFSLCHLSGDKAMSLPAKTSASVLLNIGKPCQLTANRVCLDVPKGQAVFIPSGVAVQITAVTLDCYLASGI